MRTMRVQAKTTVLRRCLTACFLLILLSLTCIARSQTTNILVYEAEGKQCPTCNGTGETTCSHCKGIDLTELTCQHCRGQDLTKLTCQHCRGTDLTTLVCEHCRGEDLTKKTCPHCRGVDLTQTACPRCNGTGSLEGRTCGQCSGTGKRHPCGYCSGTGKQHPCVYCSGIGKRHPCVFCSGTGKQAPCVYCSGTGKQKPCVYCQGKAAHRGRCQACNGFGIVEVLTAKYSNVDDLRKSVISKNESRQAAPLSASSTNSLIAEDGSRYGSLDDFGQSKTIFVHGYVRKDGTVRKTYFRSFPSPTASSKLPSLNVSPGVAENGSYYGESNKYGVPKTVYVNGYYRSDGTYVRGHYRSAPHR